MSQICVLEQVNTPSLEPQPSQVKRWGDQEVVDARAFSILHKDGRWGNGEMVSPEGPSHLPPGCSCIGRAELRQQSPQEREGPGGLPGGGQLCWTIKYGARWTGQGYERTRQGQSRP